MYVIKKGGIYVAMDGIHRRTDGSYTRNIKYAKVFATHEGAEAEMCPENECVVCLNSDLPPVTGR